MMSSEQIQNKLSCELASLSTDWALIGADRSCEEVADKSHETFQNGD